MINSLKGLVAQIATTPLSDDHHDDHNDVDYDDHHDDYHDGDHRPAPQGRLRHYYQLELNYLLQNIYQLKIREK